MFITMLITIKLNLLGQKKQVLVVEPLMIFNNNGTTKQWYSLEGGQSQENLQRNINTPITSNTVFKFVISNTNTISFYVDDVLIATDNCRSGFSNYLRIDDFTSTPLDLDYVIVV